MTNFHLLAEQLTREREWVHAMTGISPNVLIVSPSFSIELADLNAYNGTFAGMRVIESLNASETPSLAYVESISLQRLAIVNA